MSAESPADAGVRRAEVVAALSLATDLGVGQPMGHALRSCLLAMELGASLGLGADDLRTVYYVALLQRVGCTADAFELSAWFDDEIAAHARTFTIDFDRPAEVMLDLVRQAGAGRPPLRRLRTLAGALATGRQTLGELFRSSCETAQLLVERLGLGGEIGGAVGQIFEHWNGHGWPAGLQGEAIAVPTRVARLAADVEVFVHLGGADVAAAVVRRRAGRTYDPTIATKFLEEADQLLQVLAAESAWEAGLAAEPEPRHRLTNSELDTALRTIADFADLKSPYFTGHSTGVAVLAATAAERCRLPPAEVVVLRRAGLVHDLGRVGVPNGIWDKPGALTDGDWELVRMHPYFTERVLTRAPALAHIGALAALHHERLDGSGYHRGVRAGALPTGARLLAAADAYHACLEPRPHRPARSAAEAADELRRAVRLGQVDGEAADAVLGAAGHRVRRRREWPASLSPREVEVLRLIARGLSNPEIARRLGVSPHTARHHVRHLYDKIGVSSRAAAALFAMQHDLLDPLAET
jgi:HD-GYP domain-containing protein (c-di-GMP phosphodiesterase class II)